MFYRFLFYLLRNGKAQLELSWKLMKDGRIPLWKKSIAIAPILYTLSPLNLIPPFVPVLGHIDDLSVYYAAMRLFESVVDDAIIAEYREDIEKAKGEDPYKKVKKVA